jgi:hypothetical protein
MFIGDVRGKAEEATDFYLNADGNCPAWRDSTTRT